MQWTIETVATVAQVAGVGPTNSGIGVDSTGHPHIGYADGNGDLWHAWRDAGGQWQHEAVASVGIGGGFGGGSGNYYLVAFAVGGDTLHYAWWTGGQGYAGPIPPPGDHEVGGNEMGPTLPLEIWHASAPVEGGGPATTERIFYEIGYQSGYWHFYWAPPQVPYPGYPLDFILTSFLSPMCYGTQIAVDSAGNAHVVFAKNYFALGVPPPHELLYLDGSSGWSTRVLSTSQGGVGSTGGFSDFGTRCLWCDVADDLHALWYVDRISLTDDMRVEYARSPDWAVTVVDSASIDLDPTPDLFAVAVTADSTGNAYALWQYQFYDDAAYYGQVGQGRESVGPLFYGNLIWRPGQIALAANQAGGALSYLRRIGGNWLTEEIPGAAGDYVQLAMAENSTQPHVCWCTGDQVMYATAPLPRLFGEFF